MKSSIILVAFFTGLAIANPIIKRQNLTDIVALVAETPPDPILEVQYGSDTGVEDTSDYDPAAAQAAVTSSVAVLSAISAATGVPDASINKRQTPAGCTVNVVSNYAGSVSPNTDTAFVQDPTIAAIAANAVTPPGYFLVAGFQGLNGAASDASYKTFISSPLSFYDVDTCAARCTAMAGCQSFNIYFERDNTYVTNAASCPASGTATSILIKCAFYGAPLKASMATNKGQYKSTGYHIVIAGSNGYTTTPQPLPGYDGPVSIGAASINAPPGPYMGVQTFPSAQPYDPSVCMAGCNAITKQLAANPIPGQPASCVYFDAYVMYENGANGQFTCTYYGAAFDSTWATNTGQTRGGNVYTIGHSYTYKVAGTPYQPSRT